MTDTNTINLNTAYQEIADNPTYIHIQNLDAGSGAEIIISNNTPDNDDAGYVLLHRSDNIAYPNVTGKVYARALNTNAKIAIFTN